MIDIEELNTHIIVSFDYGSTVYGTNTEYSDKDIICIIDNSIDLSSFENSIFENKTDNGDFQYINHSTFLKMIYDHHIVALESLWMSPDHYSDYELFQNTYAKYFILDKYKLRCVISSICSNAWVKCKKKLIVEKDYDWYRAAKSMFHSLRLYLVGIQIATYGKIVDYSEANYIWNEIFPTAQKTSWEEYKAKYKPLFNNLHTKFAILCPKK